VGIKRTKSRRWTKKRIDEMGGGEKWTASTRLFFFLPHLIRGRDKKDWDVKIRQESPFFSAAQFLVKKLGKREKKGSCSSTDLAELKKKSGGRERLCRIPRLVVRKGRARGEGVGDAAVCQLETPKKNDFGLKRRGRGEGGLY